MGGTTTIENSRRLFSLLQQCGRPSRILDAGCGYCAEFETLRACFPDSTIIGVDFDLAALRLAHKQTSELFLIQADLNRLPLNGTFDLILVRHPDVHRRADEWRGALATLCNFISPTGRLLATTYTAAEMTLIQTTITQLQAVPLNIAALEPVSLHGRDKVASLFHLPDESAVR